MKASLPRIVAIFALLVVLALASSDEALAQEGESLRSLVERIVFWGKTATGFSEHRWDLSRKQPIDSVKGKKISFSARVIAPDIKVNREGRAYYDDHVGFGYQPLEKEMRLTGVFSKESMALRSAESFEVLTYYSMDYRLWDSSDRLALKLEGRKMIDGTGWISDFKLGKGLNQGGEFYLEIVMTSWVERSVQPPNF